MFTSLRFPALFAALFILVSNNVAAINFCLPQNAPKRFVGDVATDGLCTDNDIQSAINNVTGSCPTTIYITREHLYTAQHLTISNQSSGLTLVGVGDGVHCGSTAPQICDPTLGCPPPPTGPLVTIDGSHTAGSVLAIDGSSTVNLRFLTITGGQAADTGNGGGINFTGTGTLTLDTSTVANNTAGSNGGGISVTASGGNATLTLLSNTLILNNTAQFSGGGIFIEGDTRLYVLAPSTLIGYNHAPNGFGGGISVFGAPARADIGSPGYNGGPVIQFNTAAYGGGISIVATPDTAPIGQVAVRMFSTDPGNPVQLSNNSASQSGGGVYVQPSYNTGASPPGPVYASFCARDFRIDNNIAPDGTAIHAASYFVGATLTGAGYISLNPQNGCYGPESDTSLGAVACAQGITCNTLNDNAALDNANQPTPGATILGSAGASVTANRFILRGNQGAHAIRIIGTYASFVNCLLADNTVGSELISIENSATVTIDACTLANNTILGNSVIYSLNKGYPDIRYYLQNSIIDQPGLVTLAVGDTSKVGAIYVLSNDTSTFPAFSAVVQGEPTFVNAAAGDYHLQITSLGIDFAPSTPDNRPAPTLDLDGMPRTVDLPGVPNVYGARDLGAYERQNLFYNCGAADSIFCNGFDH